MFLKNIKDLNGCLKDDIPCKDLLGSFNAKPYFAGCRMGNECGRGSCCFYSSDNDKSFIKQIQKLLEKEI